MELTTLSSQRYLTLERATTVMLGCSIWRGPQSDLVELTHRSITLLPTIKNTQTMAEATITEESIRAALTERLKATHVEIQDMSGTPRPPAVSALTSSGRQKAASHRQQPLSSNAVKGNDEWN